jgi:hypothetical protein
LRTSLTAALALGSIAEPPRPRPALSPDGRLLAIRWKDGPRWGLSLLDWRAAGERAAPDAAALDRLWNDLASVDSQKGFRAVVELGASPTQAARLIAEKLKRVNVPDAKLVTKLIAALGSEKSGERFAAERELARLGDAIVAELREATRDENGERQRRASDLLRAAERRGTPERLRVLRTVEVLEYADTPTGRDVLKALAAGAPTSLLTRDARAALNRLEALDPKP